MKARLLGFAPHDRRDFCLQYSSFRFGQARPMPILLGRWDLTLKAPDRRASLLA